MSSIFSVIKFTSERERETERERQRERERETERETETERQREEVCVCVWGGVCSATLQLQKKLNPIQPLRSEPHNRTHASILSLMFCIHPISTAIRFHR